MSVERAASGRERAVSGGLTRATVFGLDVCAERRVRCLEGARTSSTNRPVDLHVRQDASEEPNWREFDRVICSRVRDGEERFRIAADSRSGYAIWGRDGGSYELSADATRLRCDVGATTDARWERFLIGQILPFAALVWGLEIFHASAVALDRVGIAFAGPSGAGKTSLALAMCELGACFLTDDVLALEPRAGDLLAHPGTPLASVVTARRSPRRADPLARSKRIADDDGERVLRVSRAAGAPVALGGLFFLDRRPAGPSRPRFEVVDDPRALLAATFNFALDTRRRLRGLLDVCALASRQRIERIVADTSVDASALAAAVADRMRATSSSV